VLKTSLERRTRLNIPEMKNREAGELKNIFIHRLGDSGNRRAQRRGGQQSEKGSRRRIRKAAAIICPRLALSARIDVQTRQEVSKQTHAAYYEFKHLRSMHVHR
jgi:hypothetical protein